jgi:hypothetical protein
MERAMVLTRVLKGASKIQYTDSTAEPLKTALRVNSVNSVTIDKLVGDFRNAGGK